MEAETTKPAQPNEHSSKAIDKIIDGLAAEKAQAMAVQVICFIIGAGGLALIAWQNWITAIGIFLVIWANNIARSKPRT